MFSEPPGSFAICPACGWEDDAVQLANPTTGGGANGESLVEAQLSARRLHRARDLPRDPSWREVSEREIAWHHSEREAANSPWPNRATDLYYWRLPFERVHTIPDWHDGPVTGLADFRGRPHRFRRRWDAEKDEYAPDFDLEPVSERALVLETQLWRIWVRWLDAFESGRTEHSTHPCLPEDRGAYGAITVELTGIPPSIGSFVATATFRGDLRRCTDGRVQWQPAAGLLRDGGPGRRDDSA